jgi:hypothetical protein
MDVITRVLTGPRNPREGIISRGKITRLIPITPRGGIKDHRKICFQVTVDLDTYSTQTLQKILRIRLRAGASTHPKRLKRKWLKDGNRNARQKLKIVSNAA